MSLTMLLTPSIPCGPVRSTNETVLPVTENQSNHLKFGLNELNIVADTAPEGQITRDLGCIDQSDHLLFGINSAHSVL